MQDKRRLFTEKQKKDIIISYSEHLEPMISIAARYGRTRQCIFKVLVKAGVNTSKAQRIERQCSWCGKPVKRRRGSARRTKDSYCGYDCYFAYLNELGQGYKPDGYRARQARKAVRDAWEGFDPDNGHIVHHVNKDCSDYRLFNLEVYASQSDHIKMHRGQDIKPIWRGINA